MTVPPSPTPRSRALAHRAFRIVGMITAALCGAAVAQTGGSVVRSPAPAPSAGSTPIPYRPFIDPINLHTHWYLLLIPLAFGIAVVYKAVRLHSLDHYWRHVVVMTTQIVGGMFALAVASFLLVLVYAKFIAERIGS